MQLPAIDQNICAQWTQQANDLYNKLPYYFMEGQAQYRKWWATWPKLLGSVAWKPNMGDTMRTVVAEPTPVMRQQAFPELLNTTPLTDVVNYRERKLDSKPRWQDFVSPHFNWLPEFQDFMKHIDRTVENINKQTIMFENIFYRTQIWHRSPYVYIAGVGLVDAPTGEGNSAGTSGKTNAWIGGQLASLAGATDGSLSLAELFKALNAFEQEIGATPYEGSGTPGADSSPLNERYALVQSGESWNNFFNDPWIKENRPLGMNIVTDNFKGDLFGRIRSKIEKYPFNIKADANFVPSFPVPELIEEDPNREDFGRTKPNPDYSKPSNSPYAVAWLLGGGSYDMIEVGPPPSEFTRNLPLGEFSKMNWNGKAQLTKNFLVPCSPTGGGGNTINYDTNSFGRYLRAQATVTVGCRQTNPQNVLPIIYKRRIGINSAV